MTTIMNDLFTDDWYLANVTLTKYDSSDQLMTRRSSSVTAHVFMKAKMFTEHIHKVWCTENDDKKNLFSGFVYEMDLGK